MIDRKTLQAIIEGDASATKELNGLLTDSYEECNSSPYRLIRA